ncbi:hypothetical protein [Aliidiomarina iranensis]|uniref:hypothetical protein n=1 Tax=Aliidiomarina iranensis TaxID=1434071 RepID=UPI000F887517|nr:hypothetical protein [Aliidiomarina iranensis]
MATGSLKGALQGAFSGAVFGAIGAQFGDAKTHVQVGAHSMAGGVLGKLHGGNFGHGFFSAGFTKWAGKEWKVDTESARNVIGNSLKQAIIGGTASRITGNKFSNGAFTAALQYIVNEAGSFIRRANSGAQWLKIRRVGEMKHMVDAYNDALESIRDMDASELANISSAAGHYARYSLEGARDLAQIEFDSSMKPLLTQMVIMEGVAFGGELYLDIATIGLNPSLELLLNAANFSYQAVSDIPSSSTIFKHELRRRRNGR